MSLIQKRNVFFNLIIKYFNDKKGREIISRPFANCFRMMSEINGKETELLVEQHSPVQMQKQQSVEEFDSS